MITTATGTKANEIDTDFGTISNSGQLKDSGNKVRFNAMSDDDSLHRTSLQSYNWTIHLPNDC